MTAKIEQSRLINYIFSNTVILTFLILPFFKNIGFDFRPYVPQILNGLLVLESLLFITLSFILKLNSKYTYILIVGFFWNYLIAPLCGNHCIPSLFYLFDALGIIGLSQVAFFYNKKKYLEVLSSTFIILIIANYFSLYLENGLFIDNGTIVYLLGIRTGFTPVIIIGICINYLYDFLYNRRLPSLKSLTIVIFGIFTLINQWVATGIIQLLSLVVIVIFLILTSKIKYIKLYMILLLILIVNFFITYLGSDSNVLYYITNILKKDITFSGRTKIWYLSIDKINENPLFGVGLNATVEAFNSNRPAHNLWLHYALEGGYINMFIQMLAIIYSTITLDYQYYNKGKKKISILLFSFMAAIIIGSIAEIQIYYPFYYLLFCLPFLLMQRTLKD